MYTFILGNEPDPPGPPIDGYVSEIAFRLSFATAINCYFIILCFSGGSPDSAMFMSSLTSHPDATNAEVISVSVSLLYGVECTTATGDM